MSEHWLAYNNKNVYYQTEGQGEPLFLLHGYQADSNVWKHIIPYLKDRFTLVIPDLPGHGKSELIKPVNDMEFLSGLLFEIVLAHGYSEINIAGHSMGGYVALAFAEQTPGYLNRLILINSHPFADDKNKVLNRKKESQLIQSGKKQLLLRGFASNNFARNTIDTNPDLIHWFTEIALRQPDNGMLADLAGMMVRTDKTNVCKKLERKVEVILGLEDNNVPDHNFKGIEEFFKASYIKNCGHMSILEKPKRVSQLIRFAN